MTEHTVPIEFDPKKPWSPKSIEGGGPKEFEPADESDSKHVQKALKELRDWRQKVQQREERSSRTHDIPTYTQGETSMIRLIFGNYDAAAMASGAAARARVFGNYDAAAMASRAADTTDATLKSFDIEAPEIEKWVNEDVGYTKRVFIGIEYLR